MNRLRHGYQLIEKALRTGVGLGLGLIFFTLIGIPSDDSEQLASLAVPIYLLVAFIIGWLQGRREAGSPLKDLTPKLIALGVAAGILLLLFLGLINSWHANGIEVSRDYLAKMNTYPMHILSGVPNEELFPNPPPDNPITGEYNDDTAFRTNPMSLYFSEKYALISVGPFHMGGFIGMAILVLVAVVVGGISQNLSARVDWQRVRVQIATNTGENALGKQLPTIAHWIVLSAPLFLFVFFLLTVEHSFADVGFLESLGVDTDDTLQVINLDQDLGLSTDSLIDGRSIRLGINFMIVILGIVAARRANPTPPPLNYVARVGILGAIVLILGALAYIRIEGSDVYFIAPSVEDSVQHDWSVGVLGIMILVFLGLVLYASRDPQQFQLLYAGVLAASILLVVPLFMTQDETNTLGRVALATMFGLGLNIVVGYAGLLDLGYVAFYAIGAYTFAFLSVRSTQGEQFRLSKDHMNDIGWATTAAIIVVPVVIWGALWLYRQTRAEHTQTVDTTEGWLRKEPIWREQPPWYMTVGLFIFTIVLALIVSQILRDVFDVGLFSPFLIAIIVALIAGAFAGILLGFPVLRLRGDYLAIVTLGFGEIISLAMKNLDSTTGGPSGALGLGKPVAPGTSIPTSNLIFLYLAIVGAALVFVVSFRLRNSRLGRAWLAMRSDEDIAQAMGINLVNVKLLAFSIGASIAALAGMLFASRQNSIFPEDFNLEVSINVLAVVIIGGMGSLPGVVVGAIVLIGMPELLRPVDDYRIMLFGLLLIMTMVSQPGGLMPSPSPSIEDEARQLAEEADQA